VNVWALLVPVDVVTVTLPAPIVALPAIIKVAVIDVLLTTTTLVTVTPIPVTPIADPVRKFVPVSVSLTIAP
jgi:hypothetical protein